MPVRGGNFGTITPLVYTFYWYYEALQISSLGCVFPLIKFKTSSFVTLPSLPVPLISLMFNWFFFAILLTAGVAKAF